jgi:predicted transcriptional regulator YdeE
MTEVKIPDKTIVELGELKLVGFRVLCSNEQYIFEIPKASSLLSERINEIKQIVNPSQQYGAFVVEHDNAENDGYWICVEVTEYEDIPSDMVTVTVPPQVYAVTRHKGENDKIMDSYNELHNWIDANHYTRLKDRWHLEKFYSWNNVKNVDVELFDTISR